MRTAAEAKCGLTCDGSLTCPWQFANNPDTECCEDASAGEPEACGGNYLCITTVDEPDAITSYCVPGGGLEAIGGEQEFQDECGKWSDTLKAAAKEQTGLTCGNPVSCKYQLANNVPGFECCDDETCKTTTDDRVAKCITSNGGICVTDENITSSLCVDCKQFNKQCPRFWNNDDMMKKAEDKCGKECILNSECSYNPQSIEDCKGQTKKCGTRVELNESNNFYYACYKDGGTKCKVDYKSPDNSCNPTQNSFYNTDGCFRNPLFG